MVVFAPASGQVTRIGRLKLGASEAAASRQVGARERAGEIARPDGASRGCEPNGGPPVSGAGARAHSKVGRAAEWARRQEPFACRLSGGAQLNSRQTVICRRRRRRTARQAARPASRVNGKRAKLRVQREPVNLVKE